MLCDLSYKEHSSGLKNNTPKPLCNQERLTPSSPTQTNSTPTQFKSSDLTKMLLTKEKEIDSLQDSKTVVAQEIQDAVKFIEKNKDLASLILQKDHRIKTLKAQLDCVLQDIENSKLSLQRSLITDLNRHHKVVSQSTPKTSQNKDLSSYRSLSPPALDKISLDLKDKKQTRYQMYKENAKTLAPQLFKSKTHRDSSHVSHVTNTHKSPQKRFETSPNRIVKHPKTQKSNSIIGESLQLVSPTARSIKNPLHAFLINSHRGISKQRIEVSPQPEERLRTDSSAVKPVIQTHRVVSSIGTTASALSGNSVTSRKKPNLKNKREVVRAVEEKKRREFELRRHTENDLSECYSSMLERFVDCAERYKEKASRLEKRNKELEETIEYLKGQEKIADDLN